MASIEVNGKSYETDEEGYLVNLAEWNEDVGSYLATTESVEMTDQHWEVINFLRDYYNEFTHDALAPLEDLWVVYDST